MTIKNLEERVVSLTEQIAMLVSNMNQLIQDRRLQQDTNQMIVDALNKLSTDTSLEPRYNQGVPLV